MTFSIPEKEGLLHAGDTIVEPTSGNTGIGIALVAAAKGYNAILVMPDSLSIERRKILKGYGAKLILTEASKGMKESIRVAEDLVFKHGYFMPMQFKNINNPKAHMKYTAKEILKDLVGKTFLFNKHTNNLINLKFLNCTYAKNDHK